MTLTFILNLVVGGLDRGDDQADIGHVRKGREAQAWPAERQTDVRERSWLDGAHFEGEA